MEGQVGTLDNLDQFKAVLASWHEQFGEALRYYVGVDIGATNTRFAIQQKNTNPPTKESLYIVRFKAASTRTIVNNLRDLAVIVGGILSVPALGACLDAAGPVSTDRKQVVVTNFPGEDADRLLRVGELPANLFPQGDGVGRTLLVNDLEATCYGIKALDEEGTLTDNFKILWPASKEGEGAVPATGLGPRNYVVAAVGTGLGVALLHYTGNTHSVVPTENGHTLVTSCAPTNKLFDEECSLMRFLSSKLYNSAYSAEFEDLVSGRGLEYAYEWVAQQPENEALPKKLDAAQIASAAQQTGPESAAANRAIGIHYRYLMRVLKQLCIGMLCGGIFLAGGNQVTNNPVMEKHMDDLRAEFLDAPKHKWVEDVQLYAQSRNVNLNLHGSLHAARCS